MLPRCFHTAPTCSTATAGTPARYLRIGVLIDAAAQALVRNAIDQEAIEVFAQAIDHRSVAAFKVHAIHDHGAGSLLHQVIDVAAVERKILDLSCADGRCQLGIFRVDLREPSPVTSTTSRVCPSVIFASTWAIVPAFSVTPTLLKVLKPAASTVILYVPGGSSGIKYPPVALLVAVTANPVAWLDTVILALATAAPEGSSPCQQNDRFESAPSHSAQTAQPTAK